jgi:gluconate kinase
MSARPKPQRLSLLIADVDGTLVDENKALTKRAVTAVRALRRKGVHFAVTSGRPPRGMAARSGHFMPPALLDSQFATLEEPGPDERPIVVSIDARPREIVDAILTELGARHEGASGGLR